MGIKLTQRVARKLREESGRIGLIESLVIVGTILALTAITVPFFT